MGIVIDVIAICLIIIVIAVLAYLQKRGNIFKSRSKEISGFIEYDTTLQIVWLFLGSSFLTGRRYPAISRQVETDMPEKELSEVSVKYRDDITGINTLQNTNVYKQWYIDPYQAIVHQRIYARYLSATDLTDKDSKIMEKDNEIVRKDREIAALNEKLDRKFMAETVQKSLDIADSAKVSTNASPVRPARAKETDDKSSDNKKDEYKEEESEEGDYE